MKWIILLVIIQTIDVFSQYVNSDQIIVDAIEIVSYDSPLNSSTNATVRKPIVFTTRQFLKIPKIILGFQKMDFDYNSISKSFEIYYENVTINGFDLIFTKYFDSKIYNIIAMYIAIESDDAYSKTISFSFSPWPTDNFKTISTPCQKANPNQNVKVIAYITGLKSDGSKNVQRHKIETKVEISSQMTIDITVQQDDSIDRSLSEIKINYIEYYTSKTNTYYDLTVFNDSTYIDNYQRGQNVYSSQQLLDLSRESDIGGIGIALNWFDLPCNQITARLEVTKKSYSTLTKYLSYQYRIWDGSSAYMFSATLAIFKMIDCSKQQPQNPINFSQQTKCVSSCPIGYTPKQNIGEEFSYCNANPCTVSNCKLCDINGNCLACQDSYLFYKQQCYSQQPAKTYCNQLTLECFDCKAGCLTCSDGISCSSCIDGYFYNNQCTSSKPMSTFCSKNKVCKSCNDNNCTNCNDQLVCISCSATQPYYFNSVCYSKKPAYTYCDENNICFLCDQLCKECTGPNNDQCTDCDTSFTKLIGSKCECLNGMQGYDSDSNSCKACSISMCNDCYGDYNICNSCSAQAELINQKCQCKDPLTYYDSYYQTCFKTTVPNCKVANKTANSCDQCIDGYQKDVNKNNCIVCSNKLYADSSNKCILPCRPNCLICINSTSCIKEIDNSNNGGNNGGNNGNNNNNNNGENINDCHFSCSTCSKSSDKNSCLICSSLETRIFNKSTNQCDCKKGYIEVNKVDCKEVADLSEGIADVFKITVYISLGIQAIFIFGLNQTNYQYSIILQQQLYLLTFYPQFSSDLKFYDLLLTFRHFSLFSLFDNITLFSQVSYNLNCLIIYTSVIVVVFMIALSFQLINFSFAQASYFRWNSVFLASRLISLYSFLLLFKIMLQDGLYTSKFALSVVTCFGIFYLLNIALHISGINNSMNFSSSQSDSNTLDSTQLNQNMQLKSPLDYSMEKPHNIGQTPQNQQEIEMISTFQQKLQNSHDKKNGVTINPYQVLFSELDETVAISKYFWLLVEFRNILTGLLIGFQGDKIWAYYTLPCISLIFIIILSFNKIQIDLKKRKFVFYIECLVTCIQIFFSFYINQISESDDQNKILILVISCCIFIVAVSIVIYHLISIIDYFKEKLAVSDARLQRQKQQCQTPNNMRMQSYFTKDQINAVLDQAIFNSNQRNPRGKKKYHF